MKILEKQMANAIRALAMDSVQQAKSGHPGMPMGMADVATVLFHRYIHIDPSYADWPNRDRFVLSAGHGSMLLYALHHLVGYEDMPIEQLKQFRQLHSKTAGHPEYGHALGIETTTGPLGQGLATSVGMAISERMLNARFGDDICKHYTYVIAGDGCLQEGISHEAIDLAGHLQLSSLIVFWDDNAISIDGKTSLSTSMDQKQRFESAGWHVEEVDGHDHDAIARTIEAAQKTNKPSLIACKTTIGFGSPNLAGSEKTHGAPLGDEEIAATKKNIHWHEEAFSIPKEIYDAWQETSKRSEEKRKIWEQNILKHPQKAHYQQYLEKENFHALGTILEDFKNDHRDTKVATRKASEMVLQLLTKNFERLIGGSADLTHSNLTITKSTLPIQKNDFQGRYIHYGIREHAMAACMNGLALHGHFIPYGGTFLVFSDYARGAIRLSALMKQQVIYVLTHDSIGLGEDGPTHQPIEHLAMLRATPSLQVLRPADILETAEAWEIALVTHDKPTVLVLSRQALPCYRKDMSSQNLSQKGAYILAGHDHDERDITLLATGSEVQIAMQAHDILEKEYSKKVVVVSMPSWELFEQQDTQYKHSILGTAPRIAIEAASSMGWHKWIGDQGSFIGMDSFGASAPEKDLYQHFGITVEMLIERSLSII